MAIIDMEMECTLRGRKFKPLVLLKYKRDNSFKYF